MTPPLSRRKFIATSAAAAGALTSLPVLTKMDFISTAMAKPEGAAGPQAAVGPCTFHGKFQVNGQTHELSLDSRETLLDVLRERLDLTGAKKGCDHGQCGACAVLVAGKRVNSCLTLAAQNANRPITTIEGLASSESKDQLHPMQQAFIDQDAFQCGYCTPGQIISAVALLNEPCGPAAADIQECMSGNLCRCGAYRNILAAINQARKTSVTS